MRYHEIFEAAEPSFAGPSYDSMADLRKAIIALHGATEWDWKLIKPSGSSYGVTLGTYHLVDRKTGKVLARWETTGCDMIPGRGKVTSGYGRVAVADSPKKPEAAPEKKEPTGPASEQELQAALNELRAQMRPLGGRWAEWRPVERADKGYQFEVRDWGEWENPPEAYDEEDYDWQVLSDHSAKLLQAIVAKVRGAYPNVNLQELGSEKNWLVFRASSNQ